MKKVFRDTVESAKPKLKPQTQMYKLAQGSTSLAVNPLTPLYTKYINRIAVDDIVLSCEVDPFRISSRSSPLKPRSSSPNSAVTILPVDSPNSFAAWQCANVALPCFRVSR